MTSRRQPVLLPLLVLFSLALVHGGQPTRLGGQYDQVDGCRPGEVKYRHRGDLFCYSLTSRLPFAHALAACRTIGGRLATIYSQEHNDLLYDMLTESSFIGAVARGHMVRHPLGDVGPGVVWSWISGETPEFTNVLQRETRGFYKQPDGDGFEGCMEMMKHSVLRNDPGNGFWGDTDCRARKPAICARKGYFRRSLNAVPKREWRYELRRARRASCAEGFSRAGVRRLGEPASRSTCLSRRQTADDFTAATRRCQQFNPAATIARPSKLAGRRRWIPSHSAGELTLFWAGADRRNSGLRWRWQEHGRDVSRHAWAAGEPRDRQGADCAAYDPARRGMVATSCETKLEFVCESLPHGCGNGYYVSASGLGCVRNIQQGCKGSEDYTGQPNEKACTAKLCPLGCPSGYSQLGLKCLMVNDTASWAFDHGQRCFSRWTRIMQPLSREENEFLRRQTRRTGRPLWIMGGDKFSRWHRYASYGLPKEPNEPTTDEKHASCAVIWFDGEWMDVDCFAEFPTVCERPIVWTECAEVVEKLKAT